MYEINVNKIYGRLAEKRITKQKLAEVLGVSQPTLHRYFQKPGKMPYAIMVGIAELVCDKPEDALDIFFSQNLHNA